MPGKTAQIRSFNRTVTRCFGVLNEKYLGRDRPLVASRLLFEVGVAGAAVGELRARLGLDSGFVSRLLRVLEARGLVTTARRPEDGRTKRVRLTPAGLAERRRIDALSNELARSVLDSLTADQAARLVAAMAEVERLLRIASTEVSVEHPASAEARSCLEEYFREIASRFDGGYDRELDGAESIGDFVAPNGYLLVVRVLGQPLGCGAIRRVDRGMGEIKRLWVSPAARRLGLGRRLLEGLEAVATRARMRTVRLDTNRSLTEALRLYVSAGYRQVAPFNDNPYAHHWFEKALSRS